MPKKLIRKKLLFFINFVIFFSSIIIIIYNLKQVNKPKSKKGCDPLNNLNEQFYIQLDNMTYPNIIPLYHNRTINFKCLNQSKKIKTILMWTKFKGAPLIDYGFGIRSPFEKMNCPVTNCELTEDRSKFNQSNLVLFHLRNKIDYIPKRAFSNQRFVHVIYESPVHCHKCDEYEDIFNLTATYRLDSDFTSVYWTDSGLYWRENPNFDETKNYMDNKKGFGAVLMTNCPKESFRAQYLNELSKYLDLDTYGLCGDKCPDELNCRKFLAENYKFFFVFENTLCKDYVTEKLFETVKYDVVPVVLGMANYTYYLPKSAFINALDFDTPKDLAKYLTYLSKNPVEYNKFFKWKKYIDVDKKIVSGGYLCEMCIKLHLEDRLGFVESKQLVDVKKKYGLNENCFEGKLQYVKEFSIQNLTKNIHSYIMSPE